MKRIVKVLVVMSVAFMCLGYVKEAQSKPELTTKPFVEVVYSGDTVDGILGEYYNEANSGIIKTVDLNRKILLFKDNSIIKVKDIIEIESDIFDNYCYDN